MPFGTGSVERIRENSGWVEYTECSDRGNSGRFPGLVQQAFRSDNAMCRSLSLTPQVLPLAVRTGRGTAVAAYLRKHSARTNLMPSPFPGMDPFLERLSIFPDFHGGFIASMRALLQPELPPPYYAAMGRRAWVEITERNIGPDMSVMRDGRRGDYSGGVVATAEPNVTQPVVIHVPHDERVETLIEICEGRNSERRVVTVIEVLSPSNKTMGEHGRSLYMQKQQELLQSKTHLIEIDLLRAGLHSTAVPRDRLQRKVTHYDYHVCLHRFDEFEDYFVYPFRMTEKLPTVSVPLLPGDGEVKLDLQAVFRRTYEEGPYSREIDYQHDTIEPPVAEEDRAFVQARLAEHSAAVNGG